MTVSRFSCPKCGKELKSAAPLPAGKKVKCPGCAAVFAIGGGAASAGATGVKPAPASAAPKAKPTKVAGPQAKRTMLAKSSPEDSDADAAPRPKPSGAVQARKPLPPPPPAGRILDDDEDDAPPRRRPRDLDDDEPPRRAKARSRDLDEDDDEERPRRSSRRRSIASQDRGSGFPWLLVGGGVGILAVAFVITAFVWPGFFRGGAGGPGGDPPQVGGLDPLAFVPEDAGVVAGIHVQALRGDQVFGKFLDPMMREFSKTQLSPRVVDAIKSADRFLMAEGNQKSVGIVQSSQAVAREGIVQDMGAQQVAGKDYYANNRGGFAAFPNPQYLIFGDNSTNVDFEKSLRTNGKAVQLGPDSAQRVRQAQDALLWTVMVFEGDGKKQLQDILDKLPAQAANLKPALANLRGAAFTLRREGEGAKVQVALQCATDQDASQLSLTATTTFNNQIKPLLALAPLALLQVPNPPPVTNLISDASNLKIEAAGTQVSLTLTFSGATMKDLEKMDPNALGGGGPGPQPKQNPLPKTGGNPNPTGNRPLDFNNTVAQYNKRLANAGRAMGLSLGIALKTGRPGELQRARTDHAAAQGEVNAIRQELDNYNIAGIDGANELRQAYYQFLKGQEQIIQGDFTQCLNIISNPGLNHQQKEQQIQAILGRLGAAESQALGVLQQAQRTFAQRHNIQLR
jgi:hypothetical protein